MWKRFFLLFLFIVCLCGCSNERAPEATAAPVHTEAPEPKKSSFSDTPQIDDLSKKLYVSLSEMGISSKEIGKIDLVSYEAGHSDPIITMYDAEISVVCGSKTLIVSGCYTKETEKWELTQIVDSESGHTYWCMKELHGLYDMYDFRTDSLIAEKDSDFSVDKILND